MNSEKQAPLCKMLTDQKAVACTHAVCRALRRRHISSRRAEEWARTGININAVCIYSFGHMKMFKPKEWKLSDLNNAALCAASKGDHVLANVFIRWGANNYGQIMIGAAESGNADIFEKYVLLGARNFADAAKCAAEHGHDNIVECCKREEREFCDDGCAADCSNECGECDHEWGVCKYNNNN